MDYYMTSVNNVILSFVYEKYISLAFMGYIKWIDKNKHNHKYNIDTLCKAFNIINNPNINLNFNLNFNLNDKEKLCVYLTCLLYDIYYKDKNFIEVINILENIGIKNVLNNIEIQYIFDMIILTNNLQDNEQNIYNIDKKLPRWYYIPKECISP